MSEPIRIIRALVAILVLITAIRIYSYLRERKRRGARDFFSFISVANKSVQNVANNPRWATTSWYDTWLSE